MDARIRLTVHQTLFSLGVATAIALGTAIVLGFGAYHVLEGYITLGELTVLIFYIAAVYQPLESISATIGHLHQNFVFLNAALAVMAEVPEVTGEAGRGRPRAMRRRDRVRPRQLRLQGPARHDQGPVLQVRGRGRGSRSWARPAPARPR